MKMMEVVEWTAPSPLRGGNRRAFENYLVRRTKAWGCWPLTARASGCVPLYSVSFGGLSVSMTR